ncbi:hypothetical protein V1511DRAFT_485688 [Dipodascopsis uninucleata]
MSYSATTIESVSAPDLAGTGKEFKSEKGTVEIRITGEEGVKYPHYLPVWDKTTKYEPLKPFDHVDPGSRADSTFTNLLSKDNEQLKVKSITPKFGSEIRGVQLSKLSDAGKDELALLAAQRGVLVFRDQDLIDLTPSEALKYSSYFGRNHIHPTSGAPKGHPEIHLIYRKEDDPIHDTFFKDHISSIAWHSDVTYEQQPPGTTFLAILEGPESGGDTIFADTQEAYERLSPEFRNRLLGLEVLHSGVNQAEVALKQGGIVRRDPVENWHPLIRQHPVTKKKALFVNPQFSRYIKGFKREESDAILQFLYDFLSKSSDLQLRANWEPRTVVVWDNRRAVHSALFDWDTGSRRHALRLTPQAERPSETATA